MTSVNTDELPRREANLITTIGKSLPDFAKACYAEDVPVVILHQDASAANYQEEEYRIMDMAVKFDGPCGKEIRIHGRNRETVDPRR